MAHSNETRPTTQVERAHPGLDGKTAGRIGGAMSAIAEAYGTDVETVVAESARAENSSAAGNDATP
jgi:hypothetical protein